MVQVDTNFERAAGPPTSLGFDFGTTNSVIARPAAGGTIWSARFRDDGLESDSFRSVLCFWEELRGTRPEIMSAGGPRAVRHFIENTGDCRFLQSLKSFATSELFHSARIYGRTYGFADLLEAFTALLFAAALPPLRDIPNRVVLGRPVRFAGANPKPNLALERYANAMAPLGISDLRFVYEPVAASFYFARRLDASANVLVADFGGGTMNRLFAFATVLSRVLLCPFLPLTRAMPAPSSISPTCTTRASASHRTTSRRTCG